MGLFATLSINDDQHNNTAIMLSDVLNQLVVTVVQIFPNSIH